MQPVVPFLTVRASPTDSRGSNMRKMYQTVDTLFWNYRHVKPGTFYFECETLKKKLYSSFLCVRKVSLKMSPLGGISNVCNIFACATCILL